MVGEVKAADGSDDHLFLLLKLHQRQDLLHQCAAGDLALVELGASDLHSECVAHGRDEASEVLAHILDPPAGKFDIPFGVTDLPADRVLIVDMGGPQSIETSNLGLKPGFLHQALVAGRDGLGHGKLICLPLTYVLKTPDAGVAGQRRRNEPGLSLVVLPHGGVEAAKRCVGENVDLVMLVPWRIMRPSRCSI